MDQPPQDDPRGRYAEDWAARYRVLLAAELARCQFTEAEAALLCDVVGGRDWEPHGIALLWVQVSEAVDRDRLAEKWQLAGHGRTMTEDLEAGGRLIAKAARTHAGADVRRRGRRRAVVDGPRGCAPRAPARGGPGA
jgi:hypothetical protein